MNVAMLGQKWLDALGLVRREVVSDDVNFLALGLVNHDVSEKRDELRRGMPLRRLAQYLAGLGVECGVQRQRAVAVVLEAMAFGASRRQWQHWIFAVECLDCGL